MRRAWIALGGVAILLVVFVLLVDRQASDPKVDSVAEPPPSTTPSGTVPTEAHAGFLYGRVTTILGATYEGRLRWGGDEEASWNDYFNGFKDQNPWIASVPPERVPKEQRPLKVFGVEIVQRERERDLGRPFMARFGDITLIEASRTRVQVTLKSGTVFDIDRHAANDLDDGVRVWDAKHGVVDLDSREIRTVELRSSVLSSVDSYPLFGKVGTGEGNFTGYIQWNRREGVSSDELNGETDEGAVGLRFDTIRSITRQSPDGSLVTHLDGRETALSGTREVGEGNRGVYVDDPRYGRVLISWETFERIDFEPNDGGRTYEDFPPGNPLVGSLVTLAGRRLVGRLVFDLDESETTETLDAPSEGVDYTIPFGLIASLELSESGRADSGGARLVLRSGEKLRLELSGDLGEANAGMLIFEVEGQSPEYVSWSEIGRIDFEPPSIVWTSTARIPAN